ncbi:MAG: phosphatase PAP2 family protein [Treponema sp.]|nr:phosphatase PAP2 family protein [Treponema sp.]
MEGDILLFIQNNIRTPVLDTVMKGITMLADHGWFWITLSLVLLIFKKTRKVGFMCCFAIGCMYLINNVCIKNIVDRARPYDVIEGLIPLGNLPDDSSFPSGHTAISFAVSVVLLFSTKKRFGIPAVILAFLIAISRMYVGVHYPTDVLGGFVIGTLCACISLWLGPKLWKIAVKILPFLDDKKKTA